MATPSDAWAVKSLNNSSGRRRFVFKSFSQRIEEIDIDVYRSLDPLRAEPSEGSSFFRDSLIDYRELNTAEDFISFYEEFLPLVQTLPQIILHKDLILSSLLSRLKMGGRLSLEAILRLIAALSRDLLGDFTPFLQGIADSLGCLLGSGADRDPEIIEQIFTSWSFIMMYLQKYLVKDVDHVLRITANLRYYPKDYIREFMAESVSFLLRKAPDQQRENGVMKLMDEVVEEPSEMRKAGVGALLSHVMRITSSRLHWRSETLLSLLVDDYFHIRDHNAQDSRLVLEVLVLAFERLYEDLDPVGLSSIWKCLMDKIKDSVTNGNSVHLIRLLTILISMVRNDNHGKINDCEPFVELVGLLVRNFIISNRTINLVDEHTEIIEKVLQLILCTIDGLFSSKNMPILLRVSSEWEPVFEIRSRCSLTFIGDLLMKHHSIFHAFSINIICALNNLIEVSNEEVVYLMMKFCEKLEAGSNFFSGKPKETFSRIFIFFEVTLRNWIGKISEAVRGNSFSIQHNRLAVLWAVIGCYSHFADAQANPSLLMELINAIDKLLMVESGSPQNIWHSLIGAALRSYHKLVFSCGIAHEESAMIRFLDLAIRYKLSPQILSAVADILDSILQSFNLADRKCQFYLPDITATKLLDALNIFAENLSNTNHEIRLSTLRILCHYQHIYDEHLKNKLTIENNAGADDSESSCAGGRHNNVLDILKSIEESALSISTSRKVGILISKLEMSLNAHEVADQYLVAALNGIIGILNNRFNDLSNPAIQLLALLVRRYSPTVWGRFAEYLEHCQSDFLASHGQHVGGDNNPNKDSGLIGCFLSDVFHRFDCAPRETVLSRLIQSLRKDPLVVESHSRQIVPLFLKFLGCDVEETTSCVASRELDKGKGWKRVLGEWLSLFTLLPNPRAFYRSQILKDVLQYRLLVQNDDKIQMKVLDCLLNWRDDFLIPYKENLKNLIDAKSLREELARWSLCRTSDESVDVRHRAYIVPIVVRILAPKVRNLKMFAGNKIASVHHRRAVLGFLAQLDVDELCLFFWLLIQPLLPFLQRGEETSKIFWNSSTSTNFEADTSYILKHFTLDTIMSIPLEKRSGFLHVVEDLLAVFDESRLNPFLNLLMNCVVRISASCTSCLGSTVGWGSSSMENYSVVDSEVADHDEVDDKKIKGRKELSALRSLCFKIIYLVLIKYKDHDFGGAFWDLFLTSVKPLIAKQEGDCSKQSKEGGSSKKREEGDRSEEPSLLYHSLGANRKKPSPLFFCFLAMSKSCKLVPLLSKEGNLIPDVISILKVPSAPESFLSYILKFIKNLLKLANELGCEDVSVKSVLIPHLDNLIDSLHFMFTDKKSPKRNFVKFPGKREFTMFNLLSMYVKEPSTARTFVEILLSLLTKRHQNFDSYVDVLQIIRQVVTVLGSACSKKILKTTTPLLISADLAVRNSICDVLDAVAANDSSLFALAKILRELNATSDLELGGLDYDKILCAYEKVNMKFFHTIQEEHALPILAHAVHDMSSEELILRQSAFRLLLSFIEFSGEILNGSENSDKILGIVNNFFLKHMGNAMNKEDSVKKVWIDLLREMVLKLPKRANLESYRVLCSNDPEQDFFINIVHIQKHRRARALSRFSNIVSSRNLMEVVTYDVFAPLLFSMLFDAENGKDEHIRNACVDSLASISSCMKWKQYYALLLRCFRDLKVKPDKQKVLLRLICSILDRFHFPESYKVHEGKVTTSDAPDPYATSVNSSLALKKCTGFGEFDDIQECLLKKLFPRIQKLLTTDSDKVNVTISLVALKLLKLLPAEFMDSQLPTIVHRISNFLKNRLESIRDEARSALFVCLKELGLEYLQFVVKVLKGTLRRGYELHVLGYTLNFLLSKFLSNPVCGKLDYCLDDLLSIVENDILGDVSEEKDVEKIASKMKETRKQKSYETLKFIAQSITFKTHVLKLLSPVTVHLQKQLSQKVKLNLENMLNHIGAGIECNPSVNQTELFIFLNSLIESGISDESNEHENSSVPGAGKLDREAEAVQTIEINRIVNVDRQFSHLITAFALGLLQNFMKKLKLNSEDEQLLRMLDPFVSLLRQCLGSKYENIITAALRCLSLLVRLPLPSLQSQADKIKNSLFVITQGSVNASSQLTESCMKLLTTLLRSRRITLSADQLHMLIQFPMFIDFAKNPSFIALSLLKAIVHRKLVVPEIYDLVQIVAELMVQSLDEPIRKKCSQILLQFLLGYHLSGKRLQQHFDFLLVNLRYEHSTGREAVLEMLHAIILKFPQNVVDAQCQTLFVHLVVSLANDDDRKVRSMSAAAIKCLIEHVSVYSLHSILEYSLSWYLGGKQNLWAAAAQVLGLLVEIIRKGFQAHLSRVLPVMRNIFQSAIVAVTSSQQDLSDNAVVPFWKEAYYSMVMFEKILHQFHNMFFDKGVEDIWETICEFLLHPHLWLRHISCRILSSYFGAVTDACRDNGQLSIESFFLMKPSILFHIAVSLYCQLKVPSSDEVAGSIIVQNLVFSICGLHSFLVKNESMDVSNFWSTLDHAEQDRFRKAFGVLDPRKGRRALNSFISDDAAFQHYKHQHPFISYLLQRMGKITFQMEVPQMKIVFNCYKSISPKLLGCYSHVGNDGTHSYAYQLLLPLYRVCEGYTGKVVSDDLKQLAQEVSESLREVIGVQNFVHIYSEIRKILKAKRDKRKQEEKTMAVVNPTRGAKRKLKVAAKNRAYKRRKIMTMKMGRWM